MTKLMRISTVGLTAIIAGLATPVTAALPITITIGQPGGQESTVNLQNGGLEDFDAPGIDDANFVSNYGGSAIAGTYNNLGLRPADVFGGAGNVGSFLGSPHQGATLDLATALPGGVTYFGLWLSALDDASGIDFYQGGVFQYRFLATSVIGHISGLPMSVDYLGNPNPGFGGDNNGSEPYVFVNFYARGGSSFDRIVFLGGVESDNHTVGQWSNISGEVVPAAGTIAAVPEPASWAMLIVGFGLVGAAARRRQAILVQTA